MKVVEVSRSEGAPALKRYLASVPTAARWRNPDVGPEADLEALKLEVPGHPVFKRLAFGAESSA